MKFFKKLFPTWVTETVTKFLFLTAAFICIVAGYGRFREGDIGWVMANLFCLTTVIQAFMQYNISLKKDSIKVENTLTYEKHIIISKEDYESKLPIQIKLHVSTWDDPDNLNGVTYTIDYPRDEEQNS